MTTISEILADARGVGLLCEAVDDLLLKRQGQLKALTGDQFRQALQEVEQLTRWACELRGMPYVAPLPRS